MGATSKPTAAQKERAEDVKLISAWKKEWDNVLKKSRSVWKKTKYFPFLYNGSARIAFDPNQVEKRKLGSFLQLVYSELPEAGVGVVHRSKEVQIENTLAHELDTILVTDPKNTSLVVIPNRWSRSQYHSMLVSKSWQPQILTEDIIRTELEWAARGVATDFHRGEEFLNHLHIHLFPNPKKDTPITWFSNSFRCFKQNGTLREGTLADFSIPQIVLSSTDIDTLQQATLELNHQLEKESQFYNHVTFQNPRGQELFSVFCVWNKNAKEQDSGRDRIRLNLNGVFRTADLTVTETTLLEYVHNYFLHEDGLKTIRLKFWQEWESICGPGK